MSVHVLACHLQFDDGGEAFPGDVCALRCCFPSNGTCLGALAERVAVQGALGRSVRCTLRGRSDVTHCVPFVMHAGMGPTRAHLSALPCQG